MTTDDNTEDGAPPASSAHQGPGRWARRGAAGIGMTPGESARDSARDGSPPTADSGEPDISPSLAGGHAGASHHDQD